MSIEVLASVAAKVGFASHQNAVPVLADLQIANPSEETYHDLALELSSRPPVL